MPIPSPSVHCWDPVNSKSKCQVCISIPDQSIACAGVDQSKCLAVCGGTSGTKCTDDNKSECIALPDCTWDTSDGLACLGSNEQVCLEASVDMQQCVSGSCTTWANDTCSKWDPNFSTERDCPERRKTCETATPPKPSPPTPPTPPTPPMSPSSDNDKRRGIIIGLSVAGGGLLVVLAAIVWYGIQTNSAKPVARR
jgi:hypothetical protein